MGDVIFARPTDNYKSYTDFWRLVELSGYPLIYMHEMDLQSDNCYIFSTPSTHWHDGLENYHFEDARARVIYYGIEWYLDVDYRSIPGVEKWFPDKWYANRVGGQYVPMGSHPDLNPDAHEQTEKKYDIVTLWGDTSRRYDAYGQFVTWDVKRAPDGWENERHMSLSQARAMCVVHQTETACVAPQRWALAAAYNLPMITETLADDGVFTHHYRLMSDLPHMGEFVHVWMRLENRKKLTDYGRALHNFLCRDYTFRVGIEGAL